MNTFSVSVLSPERQVAKAECTEAIIPTEMGVIAVLPNHAPLATILKSGAVELKQKDGKSLFVAVTGGFATVEENTLTLLTDFAARDDEIDEKLVRAAKAQAEKTLEELKHEPDLAKARTELLRASLQLDLLNKHHRGHHTSPTP